MKLLIVMTLACAWYLVAQAREEMSALELVKSVKIVCKKNTSELWEKVIRCHDPINDMFLRASEEANCGKTSSDPDPHDTSVPIRRVFEILCNVVGSNPFTTIKGGACLLKGHDAEVKDTQEKFGEDVPENIVKCIRGLNLDKL